MSRRTFKLGLWDAVESGIQDGLNKEQDLPNDGTPDIPDRTCNEVTKGEYQYSALKGGPLSMRLVELLPGTRQEDIACRMYETLLDECTGSYEALSYVWGDTSKTTPIQINDETLEIGTNLRLALFNIPDVEERNQQVAVMGAIYRRAKRTIVWLRDQAKRETKAAFAMMNNLAEDAISLSHAQGSSTSDDDSQDKVLVNNLPVSLIEKDSVDSPMFNRYNNDFSVIHVLDSPWWHRAWTIQEILLSSSATIVVGRYDMDWSRFCIAGNHGLNLGIWMPLTMGLILDPVVMPYLSLQLLESKLRTQDPNVPPAQVLLELLVHCRFREATDPRDKIYALLGLAATTSPYPLAEPTQSLSSLGIQPDYSSPVSTVYTHAARQMILKSDTLDVLGACVAIPSPPLQATDSALPSWVPDWNNTAQPASLLLHDALGQPRTTHATAHSKAQAQFINGDSATLLLHAHEVTTLAALAPPLAQIKMESSKMVNYTMEPAEKPPADMLARLRVLGQSWKLLSSIVEVFLSIVPHLATYVEWETFARAVPPTNPGLGAAGSKHKPSSSSLKSLSSLIHSVSNLSIPALTPEEPDDPLCVYWQTLCTGTYVTTANPAARRGRKIATQQLFYSWRASLKPIYDMHRWHVDRMLRPLAFVAFVRKTWRGYSEFMRFVEGSYGRRLGRAVNGYLCLVPATAEVGDKVVLARGGRVPLVVRRDGETGYWRFVGEAYVHGIMDGEAWQESKCEEFKIR